MAQTTNPDIEILCRLQELDKKIRQTEKEKNETPPEISDLRERKLKVDREIENLTDEMRSLEKERGRKELDLEGKLASIERYRTQKNEVKTNEAYSALLKEMEEAETQKQGIEESILVLMQRMEDVTDLVTEKKKSINEIGTALERKEKENAARVQELGKQLEESRKRWDLQAARVDRSLLERYKKIRDVKGGIAFVPVRNNTCQGCFMQVTPQVISELMAGKIMNCERCSRLLYWEGSK